MWTFIIITDQIQMTPLEETARALDGIVRSGKALYVGISNYNKEQTIEIAEAL